MRWKPLHHGRNAEHTAYRDDRFVTCGRCKMQVNMDRHTRAPYGSSAGQGISTGVTDEAWVTATPYVVGNTVTGYKCLVTHTSGTFATDLAAGYWVADTTPNDFSVTGGCPFCGAYTFDKKEYHA